MKQIGEIIHDFEEQGLLVLAQGSGVLGISVPAKTPDGLTGDELANSFSEAINRYVTENKMKAGAIQIQYVVRAGE